MYSMESMDYMDYMNIFSEAMEELGLNEEVLLTILGITAIVAVLSMVFNLLMYIFESVAYCSVANRRGIHHGWLAWLPIGREWITGCIADQYQYTTARKQTKFRVVMMVLSICAIVLNGIFSGVSVANMASYMESLTEAIMEDSFEKFLSLSVATGTISGIMSFLTSCLSIAIYVLEQIMLYYYYSSCCPKSKVALLVLGILFPITIPFFLFFNRKKDKGMVPAQPQQPTPYAAYQSEQNYNQYQ